MSFRNRKSAERSSGSRAPFVIRVNMRHRHAQSFGLGGRHRDWIDSVGKKSV
jgi:hypothetical protein